MIGTGRFFFSLVLLSVPCTCLSLSSLAPPPNPHSFLIIGGTGRIGTAVASHLLLRSPESKIILAGRDAQRCQTALTEVLNERPSSSVTFETFDWKDNTALQKAVQNVDCVIHTAGPFLGEDPCVLREAISSSSRCIAYVDVSDPLDYLEKGLAMDEEARDSGTSSLLAAGAFPGLSNVLAIEAANALPSADKAVRDVRFNYFTAGLGGSGDVNLYITNLGFGEPMVQYEHGKLSSFEALSGAILGKVSFFLEEEAEEKGFGNDVAKASIGTQTVFSWPFPEAATVPKELNASGESSAAMGTAPDAWNVMLGVLVTLVPRAWWRSPKFSQFLADFSQPLVKLTDFLLKVTSPADRVGETHAMRVDVIGDDEEGNAVSVVQAHESFRRCVGQSCAEFAIDLLNYPSPGVMLPEQRYRDDVARSRIVKRLTSTPGTLAFTGATAVRSAPPPSDMTRAMQVAKKSQ